MSSEKCFITCDVHLYGKLKEARVVFLNRLKEEKLFLILLFLAFILLFFDSKAILHLYYYVDWVTIVTLTGLLIVSNGIKESNILDKFALRLVGKIHTERELAFFLITISAMFSMFLTNDITLFILVPLTLSFQKFLKNDIKKIVIFEALAVNVGSMLTPIGNPQNLLLWHMWKIGFFAFALNMLPLEILMMCSLLAFSALTFKKRKLTLADQIPFNLNNKLAVLSIGLLSFYIFLMEFHLARFTVAFILLFYLFAYRKVLKEVDWFLLLVFILMFIDVHLFSDFPFVVNGVKVMNLQNPTHVFFLSLGFSQVASNVPAAIFVSRFSHSYLPILYGVNIGGNGFVIGSLANIIALRMVKGRKVYADFHKYSFTYFFITALIGYILLKIFKPF